MVLTAKQRAAIAKAYFAGAMPSDVASEYGISTPHVLMISKRQDSEKHNARRKLYRDRVRKVECAERREASSAKRDAGLTNRMAGRSAHFDALRLMAEIPRDTRSLTALAFGDPLPGRSALDLKQAR